MGPTVARLRYGTQTSSPDDTARPAERAIEWCELERNTGRDLQFIRINGTLVGGLVGLGI